MDSAKEKAKLEIEKATEKAREEMLAAAARSTFAAGVVGVGKPMTVKATEIKMRVGPTLAPRKPPAAGDIF